MVLGSGVLGRCGSIHGVDLGFGGGECRVWGWVGSAVCLGGGLECGDGGVCEEVFEGGEKSWEDEGVGWETGDGCEVDGFRRPVE